MALKPISWPRVISASSWSTVLEQLYDIVVKARGKHTVPYPVGNEIVDTVAPKLTNGDVIKLLMAIRAEGGGDAMPLWAQFAGTAYAWDPERKPLPKRKLTDPLVRTQTKILDVSSKRAAAPYPDPMLVEFWLALQSALRTLEFDNTPNPRLYLDGSFSDIVFQAEVMRELQQDGAASTAAFKVPVGCKNPDGTTRSLIPKCKHRMKEFPYLCYEYEKCDPVSIDIDPLKPLKDDLSSLFRLGLVILLGVALFDNRAPSRRRG